eukprot:s2034_g8.t1
MGASCVASRPLGKRGWLVPPRPLALGPGFKGLGIALAEFFSADAKRTTPPLVLGSTRSSESRFTFTALRAIASSPRHVVTSCFTQFPGINMKDERISSEAAVMDGRSIFPTLMPFLFQQGLFDDQPEAVAGDVPEAEWNDRFQPVDPAPGFNGRPEADEEGDLQSRLRVLRAHRAEIQFS